MLKALKNITYTENSALSNKSTGSAVLDFFYHSAAKRGKFEEVQPLFEAALLEDHILALKALFYLRDIRGGKGERQMFRDLFSNLFYTNDQIGGALMKLIPEYGRWDDVPFHLVTNQYVRELVKNQLLADLEDATTEQPISLLAKWMPSNNTSSQETRDLAYLWQKVFGWSARTYRKNLSALREYLDVPERKMSARRWKDIDYAKVPSRAAMIYRKAFMKHDPEGYAKYIEAAVRGDVKINSKTLYPHEITGLVRFGKWDETLEAMWNQLPNYAGDLVGIVVADESDSMTWEVSKIPGSKYYAADVANALAIYFADKNAGAFAHHFITFSNTPVLRELKGETLKAKMSELRVYAGGSTNIQAVFNLILSTGVRNNVPQNEMPKVIFIVSDMQFNQATNGNDRTNYEVIKQKYQEAGYEMPKLVFWNVASRVNETPVTQDTKNTFLASGFSTDVFQKVLNLDTSPVPVQTPYELMLHTLNSERYKLVDDALKG